MSQFIVVDWGTTSFRAYRVRDGVVIDTVSVAGGGIRATKDFAAALEDRVGRWGPPGAAGQCYVVGMASSPQGWVEVPHVPTPASAADCAAASRSVRTPAGREVVLITGVKHNDRLMDGLGASPDVMRGEESQLFGAAQIANARGKVIRHFVCPGTHSKWATVGSEGGASTVVSFHTFMTGEVYGLMRGSSILSSLMPTKQDADEFDAAAFAEGVRRATGDGAGLLRSLFTARTGVLSGALAKASGPSYLSGVIIGSEIAGAIAAFGVEKGTTIGVVGSPLLQRRYAAAFAAHGLVAEAFDPVDAVVKGVALVAQHRAPNNTPAAAVPSRTPPSRRPAPTLAACLQECPVVAILRGVKPSEAVAVAEAVVSGGVRVVEVPLNSPQPLESIRLIANAVGDRAVVGAGTVLTPAQVQGVVAAGGRLIVAPNFDAHVVAAAKGAGVYTLPGVLSPTEAFAALHAGADGLKFFPADVVGPAGIKAMRAVLPPKTLVAAVGGVDPGNMKVWRNAGADSYGIGSYLYKPGRDIGEIRRRAEELTAAARAAAAPTAAKL